MVGGVVEVESEGGVAQEHGVHHQGEVVVGPGAGTGSVEVRVGKGDGLVVVMDVGHPILVGAERKDWGVILANQDKSWIATEGGGDGEFIPSYREWVSERVCAAGGVGTVSGRGAVHKVSVGGDEEG